MQLNGTNVNHHPDEVDTIDSKPKFRFVEALVELHLRISPVRRYVHKVS